MAYAGRGDENAAPFINLLANFIIKGVKIYLSASDFLMGGTQIRLGADLKSAAIVGNRFRAGKNIENNSKGDMQFSANVAQ